MNNEDAVKPEPKMPAEVRAAISERMKAYYRNNPDKKPGRGKGGRKKRNPNVTEVPLDAVRDVPEKVKRGKYTKKEKKIVVGDELKLEVIKLLNKLL